MLKQSPSCGLSRVASACLLGFTAAVLGTHALQAQAPLNNDFVDRAGFFGATNSVEGANTDASNEPGEPRHAGYLPGPSVWWSWVAPESGLATLDTIGSGFDTVLEVYTGSALASLQSVAANDDASTDVRTSRVQFACVAGQSYEIVVDGYGQATGAIVLNVNLPVPVSPPVVVSEPADLLVAADGGRDAVFSVTVEGSHPRRFQWQKNGTPIPGATEASLVISGVAEGDEGEYAVVVSNPYGEVTSRAARLEVGFPPANDNFAGRFALEGPLVITNNFYSNLHSTLEPGEPLHGNVECGASVWWQWTAPANGLVGVSTVRGGEPLPLVVSVYAGTNLAELTELASHVDPDQGIPSPAPAWFRAQAGEVYPIAVAGLRADDGWPAEGSFQLELVQERDNDYFGKALPIPEGVATVRDNNTGATLEAGELPHLTNAGGASVWWQWTAPAAGGYTVNAAGSAIPAIVDVYTMLPGGLFRVGELSNPSVANNDVVNFVATEGAQFYFSLDGYKAEGTPAQGALQLNIQPIDGNNGLLNDAFEGRLSLSGMFVSTTGNNAGATKQGGEPRHAGNDGGASVWWSWLAAESGTVVVSTAGSSFDTLLGVYTGKEPGSLGLVAANDDEAVGLHTSRVSFEAVAGTAYAIAVDGYRLQGAPAATGDIVLALHPLVPPVGGNDDFADRHAIVGREAFMTGDNARATKELGEPNHAGNPGGASLWWSWTAEADGIVAVDTEGTAIGTALAVYTGDSVDALAPVNADMGSGLNGSSRVTFNAVPGVDYAIAVDSLRNGNSLALGTVQLNFLQMADQPMAANDLFDAALRLSSVFPFSVASSVGSTREPGEPEHCDTAAGASLWWKWTPTASRRATFDTVNSDFDTLLSVYTGSALGDLVLVAESDDISPDDPRSRASFQTVAGTTYYIAVDGYGDQVGQVHLNLGLGATVETAPVIDLEPVDWTVYGAGGGTDLEARFAVRASGSALLNYQWFHNGQELSGATNAALALPAVSGADAGGYHVEVSNAQGLATSRVAELRWVPETFNDNFADSLLIPGRAATVFGNNSTASDEPGLGQGGRDLWWRWVAPADGPVELSTYGSSFATLLSLSVFTPGGELEQLALVGQTLPSSFQAGTVVTSSRLLFYGLAGQEYRIAVGSVKTNDLNTGSLVLSLQQPPAEPAMINDRVSPEGYLTFLVAGTPGARVRIESTSDFIDYTESVTVFLPDEGYWFTDSQPVSVLPMRFFRVVAADLPLPPGETATTLPVYTNPWDIAQLRVVDKNTDLLYVNANQAYLDFLQELGYGWATNVAAIQGKTAFYFLPEFQAEASLEQELQVLETGVDFEELVQVAQFGSEPIWQHVHVSPLRDAQGNIYALRREFYDVPPPGQTVIPEPRNEWESSQLFILDKNTNSVFINANSNYIASLQANFPEIQSVDDLSGRDDTYFYVPDQAAKFQQDDAQVMSSGIGYEAVEANQQVGGEVTYVHVTKVPLWDDAGNVFGVHVEFYVLAQLGLQAGVDGSFELTWPAEQTGYHAQEAATVNGPWTDLSTVPIISEGQFRLGLEPGGENRFYRLVTDP